MLIQVDTDTEPTAGLLLASTMLANFAAMRDDHPEIDCSAPTVTVAAPAAPNTPVLAVAPVVTGEPGPLPNADVVAAQVFAKAPAVPAGTNVLPFPTLPQANIAAPVTAPTTLPPVLSSPVLPAVTLTAAAATGGQGVEVDSAGLHWDERIHQATRGKKKTDGTWKLKKGLDPAIAQAITAELLAKKNAAVLAPQVTLPQLATLPPSMPLPPAPGNTAPVPGAAQLPVSGQPATGAVPPLEAFRNMMQKIGDALKSETVTQARVNEVHVALGLPQLQLAITQPQLIPQIEAALGL